MGVYLSFLGFDCGWCNRLLLVFLTKWVWWCYLVVCWISVCFYGIVVYLVFPEFSGFVWGWCNIAYW